MIKICICWGSGGKFQISHCICFPLVRVLWPPPGPDPGPLEKEIEVGGVPLGNEIRVLAGLATLRAAQGINAELHKTLGVALDHATRELQAKLPEGFKLHLET